MQNGKNGKTLEYDAFSVLFSYFGAIRQKCSQLSYLWPQIPIK